MRVAWLLVALLTGACLLSDAVYAGEKQVTLKGTILCARCALKETKTCQTVIRVKEAGKEVSYYFKDKGHDEEYHEEVCGGAQKQGTVIGAVFTKDGKQWVTPKKVTYAK